MPPLQSFNPAISLDCWWSVKGTNSTQANAPVTEPLITFNIYSSMSSAMKSGCLVRGNCDSKSTVHEQYNEQCFLVMFLPSQTGKHTAYIYCIDKVQTHTEWKVYITVQCASLTSNKQRQVLTYKQWYRAKITPDLYRYSHRKLCKWTIFIYFLFNHNYLKAKL